MLNQIANEIFKYDPEIVIRTALEVAKKEKRDVESKANF